MSLIVLDRRKDLLAANDFHLPPREDNAAEEINAGFRVDDKHFTLPRPGFRSELRNVSAHGGSELVYRASKAMPLSDSAFRTGLACQARSVTGSSR
jgi:hypothetical protein